MVSGRQLAEWVRDARQRTVELAEDLSDEQLLGPRLSIVNPPLWEVGHVAWFQERWVLRHAGGLPPIRGDADVLYDSAAIAHDTRWDLLLPSRADTFGYLSAVRDRVLDQLEQRPPTPEEAYFVILSVFHEDMHTEAFLYTRQTLGYPRPRLSIAVARSPDRAPGLTEPRPRGSGSLTAPSRSRLRSHESERGAEKSSLPGDVPIPGGTFLLGALPGEPFVFDNEKWAHPVTIKPFAMARAPVTQEEYVAFVDDGGYGRPDLWSEAGWRWRQDREAQHPVYWQREPSGWRRRDFDCWLPLEPHRPVLHVSWYEAEAYCRWTGRRLPTEAEWEVAAAGEPGAAPGRKRRFPWGDEPPTPERACLDGADLGCADVAALPAGDSAFGCRQMIGNVWEWTADDFLPYPGFVADPYKEYSQPWFGDYKVLRGGCWATRARLLRNTWRNFYKPDRRDVWAGFRTCALEP